MPAPQFGAVVADQYEQLMVPMFFAPYARDLAERVAARSPKRVLELAAGTGAVTRELAAMLPPAATIVATDLHAAMIERAAAVITERAITWQVADAQQLPFGDATFDVVACQFGVMFFPDRVKAYSEMRRVVRPGGAIVFSTWGSVADNDFDLAVDDTVTEIFAADPPNFFARVPHGYFDAAAIIGDLAAAGLVAPQIDSVTRPTRAERADIPARALCAGTPLRNEIETRDPQALDRVIAATAELIAKRFGTGRVEDPVAGKMQALVVEVVR
jgi:ubiquinone/menaquinone biosynthesis C-methylase UbiE